MKSASKHYSNNMQNNNPDSIFLDPVTPEEVNDMIANLDENKVELKNRRTGEKLMLDLDSAASEIAALVKG